MLTSTELNDIHTLVKRSWCLWNSEEFPKLYLCPLIDFINVPNGTVMVSIIGQQVVKGVDHIDEDTRGGFLAYGVQIVDQPKPPEPEPLDWRVDFEKLLP